MTLPSQLPSESVAVHRGLLAIAREHFGNLPHRRPLVEPGQELVRG